MQSNMRSILLSLWGLFVHCADLRFYNRNCVHAYQQFGDEFFIYLKSLGSKTQICSVQLLNVEATVTTFEMTMHCIRWS